MNRADEIKKILDEVAEGTLCVVDGTKALLVSEEERMKPLREVYEKLKNKPIEPLEPAFMWQAIKKVVEP